MQKLSLLALALLPALQAQDTTPSGTPKETVLPDEAVVVPIDTSQGWAIVEVGIGDQGPFRMILDTGAMGTMLDADLAEELGLVSIGKTRMGDPSNPEANEVDIVELPYLRVGDAYFEEVQAVSWAQDIGLRGRGIRGVLGLPVFEECLLTLDYPAGELRLVQGELPPADGRRVLGFRRGEEGLINVPIEAAGVELEAHLDSGNQQTLILPGALEGELPLVAGSQSTGRGMRASGPVEFSMAILDGTVSIGGIVLAKPQVRFDSSMKRGNLGRSFFELGPVTLDLANSRMELGGVSQRAAAQPVAAQPAVRTAPSTRLVDLSHGRRRLGIEMRFAGGREARVSRVQADSLAEAAGLEAGDLLLAVNGKAVSQANMDALSAALATPAAFEIEVQRGAERIVIAVPGDGAPAPVEPDSVLDRLLGTYTVEARMWRTPDAEPESFTGQARFDRAHEGRFVRESFTLRVDDRELAGEAYLAWRPQAERFELTQIDAFSPTTFWLTGAWDAARERLAFRSVPSARIPPEDDELRWEYRFEEDGVFVKEMLGPGGSDENASFVLKSDYRYTPVEAR